MIRSTSPTPATSVATTALSRRRLLVATLSAAGSAGLAGCAANGDASTTPGGAASASGTAGGSAAASKKVTLYCGADTNIQALWQKTLIPGFAKAHPEFPVDFVFSEHGTNDPQEQARLAASAQTGTVQGPLLTPVEGRAVPYRGSAVLLASGFAAVPDALIEAARDTGAPTARVVVSIMAPMASVPLVIATTFTAIGVLGSFTVPYLLGPTAPNLLGTNITQTFQAYDRAQQAQAMAVVLFGLAIVIGAAYVWANVRSARRASVTS